MILVDTSVWIAVFRRQRPIELTRHLVFDDVVTCPPIIQEVLQGFRDEGAYRTARAAMLALPCVESSLDQTLFLEAAELYRAARRRGLTIRSSVDCLLTVCALRNDLEIVHTDRDFDALAKVCPLRRRRLVA